MPEWITEIYYGNVWYPIQAGSYEESKDEDGNTVTYKDAFSGEIVFLLRAVEGYKIKPPEPEEPKASVIELHPKK